MEKDFCRRIALGGLIQGCFHNLNSTLQTLSFHLQFLKFKRGFLPSEEISDHIEKAFLILQKIQKQVKVALDRVREDGEGPWNLKEILEEELIFWENFLPFKHKVNKTIKVLGDKVEVKFPLNLLRGILCNIGFELFPYFEEETNLNFLLKNDPYPQIIFSFDKVLKKETLEKLKRLSEFFKNWINLKVEDTLIRIEFYG
ncbi:MAG: hypothetical protein NZ530_02510 [Thermodesulfobacteriaceae bacterium]|nr:hypothetical protein [Thermodesulfobacteriaceae bacterium]MCX8041774.1 hypothetical protein [Thermodesulfobacteriaceae bacterium]MDW8136038.1 hypothetical protein [Thermodesulfobacterium sp.]